MKRIVTVGGGTGSYTILTGLKHLPNISLTALVSMADDGGSTGVLRDELGVLPAGDVRQCLVALSDHSDSVRKMMSYRFSEGTLSGHSFGNIFLAALEKVTGNFAEGVEIASDILKVKGKVIPITKDQAKLSMKLASGEMIIGEDNINHANIDNIHVESIFYTSEVVISEHAKEAIMQADIIILGPGNYYCSVIPNLVVQGFKEAVQSSTAKVIFPVNLTNKHGHTMHWKVSDYVSDIEKYLGREVDIILVNSESPNVEQVLHYKMQEGDGVLTHDDMKDDPRVARDDLLSHALIKYDEADLGQNMRSFIRHDKDKFREAIAKLL